MAGEHKDKQSGDRAPEATRPGRNQGAAQSQGAEGGATAATPSGYRTRRAWLWIGGPVLAFAVLVTLIFASGRPEASQLMSDATTSFGQVRQGNFQFAITITPQGDASATTSSIELSGPFALVPGKPLPLAHINYTVTSGERTQEVTLLTTGEQAYTVIKGQAYELPESATKQLKSATDDLSGKEKDAQEGKGGIGLSGLNLNFNKWLIDPVVSEGGMIDGTPTWATTSKVNVVEAVKDLTRSMGALGSITGESVPALKESQIKDIEEQIKEAEVTVHVGRYDHIVRRMDLTMTFKTPDSAAAETGGISGGKMQMRVAISEPNRDVDVKPPKNPLPYSALQSLVSGNSSRTGTALDDGAGR